MIKKKNHILGTEVGKSMQHGECEEAGRSGKSQFAGVQAGGDEVLL